MSKRKRRSIEKESYKLFDEFEEKLTFDTFFTLCEFLRENPQWQIADTFWNVGHKIPVPELKKILEFIEGQPSTLYQDIELSICHIFQSHSGMWKDISDERLNCLIPYMDDSFWSSLFSGELRDPKTLSTEEFRAVFRGIFS